MKNVFFTTALGAVLAIVILAVPAQAQRRGGGGWGGGVYHGGGYYPGGYYDGGRFYGGYGSPFYYGGGNYYGGPYFYGSGRGNFGQPYYYSDGGNPQYFNTNPIIYSEQPAPSIAVMASSDNNAGRAEVDVKVPDANAQVWFQGAQSLEQGKERKFWLPSLAAGDHSFTVRGTWMENGQQVTRDKVVHVSPGKTITVDLAQTGDQKNLTPAQLPADKTKRREAGELSEPIPGTEDSTQDQK